ncbi:hypothetical protein [Oceanithermus profundus]
MNSKRGWFLGTLAAGLLLLAGCGNQNAGGFQVQGKLLDLCGQPLPYKTVFVPGHDPVLTAEDGSFTINGVAAPYDLVISNAYLMPEGVQEVPVLVYKGLTKPDPVVWANDAAAPRNETCAHASASGAITPAQTTDDFRNGAALVVGPYVGGGEFAYDASPNYDVGVYFDPDLAGENNATLFGIQWQRDTATNDATSFLAAKKLTVSLGDGDALGQDLALTEIGSRDLNVSVQLPGVMDLDQVEHHVTVDGVALPFATAQMNADEAGADGGFAMAGPVGEGLGSLVVATASYGGGGLFLGGAYGALDLTGIYGDAGVWQQAAADSNDVALSFPDPVVPIVPLNGATIDPDTTFRWAGPEGTLYDVVFILDLRPDVSVEVVTTEPQLQLPDLNGMGMRIDSAFRGYWLLAALGGEAVPGSVDELASASARSALVPFYLEYSAPQGSAGYFFFVDAGGFSFAFDALGK